MRVKYFILWVILGVGLGVIEGRSLSLRRHRHRRSIIGASGDEEVKTYSSEETGTHKSKKNDNFFEE
ncbi:MAG: hypothetical protein LBJ81_02165 [Puniceicoccales bacterium]|jgi:hypothetical protein|nr:hypothetical protein [Puniceicoccales bacterium]